MGPVEVGTLKSVGVAGCSIHISSDFYAGVS